MTPAGAVRRVELHDPDVRVYFDAQEQIVGFHRRCRTCGAWPQDEAHIPPCSPERSAADSMDRIRTNIYRMERYDKVGPPGTRPGEPIPEPPRPSPQPNPPREAATIGRLVNSAYRIGPIDSNPSTC